MTNKLSCTVHLRGEQPIESSDAGSVGIPPNPATAEEVLERLEEVVEEGFEAVGESGLALDERVERARASVETALNELVRALPGG